MASKLSNTEIERFADAYNRRGSLRAAAGEVGCSHGKASNKRYRRAIAAGLIEVPGGSKRTRDEQKAMVRPQGRVHALSSRVMAVPPKHRVSTYLLTCAQNDTRLHEPLWRNLQALAEHYGARIMVARLTYDKRGQAAQLDKKVAIGSTAGAKAEEMTWDDRIPRDWFADDRVELAPGLVWCGEMNIIPTAVRPLSGLEAYTGRKSGIFPHVKLAMESVATHKGEGTKFNYTTGTVTQRNYIQRKAGLKAEFHHCYGALLAEVDSAGTWFCRQINADSDGAIHDVDVRVKNGVLTTGNYVEAINWGDIHAIQTSSEVDQLAWGERSMFEVLRPCHQFMHDLLDFRARNHHELRDPHKMFRRHVEGQDDVAKEIMLTAKWLAEKARLSKDCQTVVVHSNHDAALGRWLRETDFRRDPLNAEFYLRAHLAKYEAIRQGNDNFDMLEWAILLDPFFLAGSSLLNVKFLREDESFIICPDANGGVECGMHGHLGPHGQRGSAGAFARMGRKSNVGHVHRASILDGVYTAGTSSELDLGYNVGPGAWSWTHVVTYPNGKRALYTMYAGKWRAKR